jgi:hypothetical protein
MSVEVVPTAEGALQFGVARKLFDVRSRGGMMLPDGQRFLFNVPLNTSGSTLAPITISVNPFRRD